MLKKCFVSFICILFLAGACFAETVMYNTKTHKYHQPSCQWAVKCTKNCIKVEKSSAIKKGGIPCKVCGG